MIASVREAHANRTHRPRHLLSGLLKCGVCGSPFAMRGQSRYICSRHMKSLSCSNTRGIRRAVIEEGGYVRGMSDRQRELEARRDEFNDRLAAVPAALADIPPISQASTGASSSALPRRWQPPATATRRRTPSGA